MKKPKCVHLCFRYSALNSVYADSWSFVVLKARPSAENQTGLHLPPTSNFESKRYVSGWRKKSSFNLQGSEAKKTTKLSKSVLMVIHTANACWAKETLHPTNMSAGLMCTAVYRTQFSWVITLAEVSFFSDRNSLWVTQASLTPHLCRLL